VIRHIRDHVALASWSRCIKTTGESRPPASGVLRGARWLALAAIAVLVAAASTASFVQSFRGLYEWAHEHGLLVHWAAAWPIQVDAFIVVGELALFVALIDGWTRRARVLPWVVTLAGLVDLDAGTVSVRRSAGVVRVKGEGATVAEGDTKSGKPRVIDIDAATAAVHQSGITGRSRLAVCRSHLRGFFRGGTRTARLYHCDRHRSLAGAMTCSCGVALLRSCIVCCSHPGCHRPPLEQARPASLC
jgi:Protein of unknown function (DUF2637)